MPDIDIDLFDRTKALRLFDHSVASRLDNGKMKPHNTGIYVTAIPTDLRNNLSTIDYKTAEQRGYFKIDILNVSIYEHVKSEEHLIKLMETEPIWELLLDDAFNSLLFHVNGHGDILRLMQPRSVEQLAAVLAMIRPAKRHLIGKPWSQVLAEVWVKPEGNEYFFKRAHSFSYAVAVIIHMNLICEQLYQECS